MCGLLAQAELEQIVGHDLLSTTPFVRAGGPVGCRWEFIGDPPGVTRELDVGITTPGGRRAFDASRPFAADGTPIPGLGVDSYPLIGNTIFALKGDTLVNVQYANAGSDPGRLDVPEQVIRLAMSRLP